MKNRTKIISILAAAAVAGTAVFSGCSLVSTDPQADMEQIIAEVDITAYEDFQDENNELYAYTDAVTNTEISKRDLVAYFINVGSSYVNDGYSYGETFELLAEALVDNEILIQYAVMATLQAMNDDDTETTYGSASGYVNHFTSLLKNDEASAYEWLLNYQAIGLNEYYDEDVDYVLLCKYSLYQTINQSIDSYEESILDSDDEDESSSATLPTNADTEVDNYYPVDDEGGLDYNIYTGYTNYRLSDSGAYTEDKVSGTNIDSRKRAYHSYISVLDANYLITDDDDIKDVLSLNYVQNEYITTLRQQVAQNYLTTYEMELEENMSENGYAYVQYRYEELLAQQTSANSNVTSYSSTLSNMSSTSFVLYTPTVTGGEFGYVYNILAPFSNEQSQKLTQYSTWLEDDSKYTEDNYYYDRNQLLKSVTTKDQRSSWFNGGKDYSFDAEEAGLTYYSGSDTNRTTLFFEDNLTNNDKYESLENYYGKYTFNGTAILNADEETYTIIANELTIDDLLDEFEGYIKFVAHDSDSVNNSCSVSLTIDNSSTYFSNTSFIDTSTYSGETDGTVDYSKFIYAMGKVTSIDSKNFNMSDLTNINSGYYTIMSAVNELQYAYTTDTSVLSQYVGYSVCYSGEEGSTGYVYEFEYASQLAIANGVGTYVVVGTDYGWHLIYVTATLEAGNTYTSIDWANRTETEGTFEYNFYQMLKTSDLENATSNLQQKLINLYNTSDCVTLYEDRYEDLTSISG